MKKILFLTGIILGLLSCKSPDSLHNKYLVPNGLNYPAKAMDAVLYPGKNRVKIAWHNGTKRSTVKARISWHNETESIEMDIDPQAEEISRIIEPLTEDTYSFMIRTYDAEGNVSVPVEVTGNVYGDLYESTLQPRHMALTSFSDRLVLKWAAPDRGTVKTILNYTSSSNVMVALEILLDETQTILTDYKENGLYYTETWYLPEPGMLDEFCITTEPMTIPIWVLQPLTLNIGLFASYSSASPSVQVIVKGENITFENGQQVIFTGITQAEIDNAYNRDFLIPRGDGTFTFDGPADTYEVYYNQTLRNMWIGKPTAAAPECYWFSGGGNYVVSHGDDYPNESPAYWSSSAGDVWNHAYLRPIGDGKYQVTLWMTHFEMYLRSNRALRNCYEII